MPAYVPPNARSKPWSRPFSNSSSSQRPNRDWTKNDKPEEQTTSTIQANGSKETRLKPFSRLRPAPIQQDPLEAAGLPSKGDATLLDFKAQENYYVILKSRYMDWCAATGVQGTLLSHGGNLSTNLNGNNASDLDLSQSFDAMSLDGSSFYESKPVNKSKPADNLHINELATIHMSMRKLREAILSTSRVDSIAQQIYIFIIRASVLTRTFESYHPALLHLLYGIHTRTPLSSSSILHEFIGYQILDTSCRLGDYGEASALRLRWGFRDQNIDRALTALIRNDWVNFWKLRESVDGYQRALMGWAEDRVRKHALKCVGKAYLSVNRDYVERLAGGRPWKDLVSKDGIGWEEDGDMLVVRRVKPVVKGKT